MRERWPFSRDVAEAEAAEAVDPTSLDGAPVAAGEVVAEAAEGNLPTMFRL